MKDREFIYWLQGFFEIANPSEVTEDQVVLIFKHLELVFALGEEIKFPFIYWLKGILEVQDNKAWDARTHLIIKNKLNDVFEHTIDKEPTKEQQSLFNNIHHNEVRPGIELLRW